MTANQGQSAVSSRPYGWSYTISFIEESSRFCVFLVDPERTATDGKCLVRPVGACAPFDGPREWLLAKAIHG